MAKRSDPMRRTAVEPNGPKETGRTLGPWVFVARWLMMIGICYAALLGDGLRPAEPSRQIFVVVLLLANLVLQVLFSQPRPSWLLWLLPAIDIAAVSIAIAVVEDPGGQLFLCYFLVTMITALSLGPREAVGVALTVAAVYGGLLYHQQGHDLLRDTHRLTRILVIVSTGVLFMGAVQDTERTRGRVERLESETRSITKAAQNLSRDKQRMRALVDVSRLGLSSGGADPGKILFQMSRRMQRALGVSRCSLVLMGQDGRYGYVAASSDDSVDVEVRVLNYG